MMGLFDSFGGNDKKCILCGKAPGMFKHAVAEDRFLCDKCAAECGYENAFFASTPAEEITKARIERDWGLFERRIEENKEAYKAFKSTEKFEKLLYLDGSSFRLYAPAVLLSTTRTPLVYRYPQIKNCAVLLTENGRSRYLMATDPKAELTRLESAEGRNLPVAERLWMRIVTDDRSHPVIILELLEGETRKSRKAFEKAYELAEAMYDAVCAIVVNNRSVNGQ